MNKNGLSHSDMTAPQRELFDELAASGQGNTMEEQNRIACEALIAGGVDPKTAVESVKKSLENLIRQGVTLPSRIPWNGP